MATSTKKNTATRKRRSFRLHDPAAGEVFLAGSFNNWDPRIRPLKRSKNGNWWTTISLEPGEYEYRFVVDGVWKSDPTCERAYRNEYGGYNSVVQV